MVATEITVALMGQVADKVPATGVKQLDKYEAVVLAVAHDEYKIFIPELLFGELRAGENFGDEQRETGGMNGLGSKLTNIFSKEITIATIITET